MNKRFLTYLLSTVVSFGAFAETILEQETSATDNIIYLIIIFLVILALALLGLVFLVGNHAYKEFRDSESRPPWYVGFFGVFHSDFEFIAAETTQDVVIHDYDGIEEYDNDMPSWWVKGFYLTIVFAFSYLGYYHIFGKGDLQTAEFEKEMARAEVLYPNADIKYMAPSTNAEDLKLGAEMFQKTCKSCHGEFAQGVAGPNLTDKYWIYGGDINTLYETIKYGRKGESIMPAQGTMFSNEDIYKLASYVMSVQGSNPANPLPKKETETIVYPE
ncbi:MAG: c-type cytochrome [Cytophagales bacterium]|nr:c-type cytochrome [Cytophagales bacterium]